jgi:hypothetical protein
LALAWRTDLDLSAGPLAANLDALYDFVLDRLVAGNVAKDPRPTEEALTVLQGLLEAWHEIARGPAAEADQPEPPPGNVLPGQPAGHSTPSPTAPLGVPGLTAGVAGLSGVA